MLTLALTKILTNDDKYNEQEAENRNYDNEPIFQNGFTWIGTVAKTTGFIIPSCPPGIGGTRTYMVFVNDLFD